MSQLEETLRTLIREIVLQESPSTPIAPRPLLSAEEVGLRLGGIDKQTVYRLQREGELKAVHLSKTRFKFHPDEVDRFIRDGGVKTKPCRLAEAPRKVSRGG